MWRVYVAHLPHVIAVLAALAIACVVVLLVHLIGDSGSGSPSTAVTRPAEFVGHVVEVIPIAMYD